MRIRTCSNYTLAGFMNARVNNVGNCISIRNSSNATALAGYNEFNEFFNADDARRRIIIDIGTNALKKKIFIFFTCVYGRHCTWRAAWTFKNKNTVPVWPQTNCVYPPTLTPKKYYTIILYQARFRTFCCGTCKYADYIIM